MRQIAKVLENNAAKRLMLYKCEDGVYLFEYDKEIDAPSSADQLQNTLEVVYEIAEEDYGVKANEWETIHDPMEFCQDDRIDHIRMVGRNTGNVQIGKFERLVSGGWEPLVE